MYIENPKTAGSGILCAIPQEGTCPFKCPDCFFQSGRSYLEPLKDNLPNVPDKKAAKGHVVRMNDGNDSAVEFDKVVACAKNFDDVFYNTSCGAKVKDFPGPVVLTVNPGKNTDTQAQFLDGPMSENLMFVRFRANMWNQDLCDRVVEHYTSAGVPVVITFLAYYTDTVPAGGKEFYTFRKRTMNSYWVIKPEAWDYIMEKYKSNDLVYSCGKDANTFSCSRCGNCLREYYATKVNISASI